MGREGSSYQDTISRLEADIAKMKVTVSEVLGQEARKSAEHQVVY